ncbi:hypothetical protein ANN_02609 [Periplaneta americana]|uniref:Uncharacterized protein n=1 Tax=Periplaneta americana TaxID=6978 RepID=A0ABQ8TWS0_PERAM|nr:hypothetical protein ANN_02609 [Periplaneta americana]
MTILNTLLTFPKTVVLLIGVITTAEESEITNKALHRLDFNLGRHGRVPHARIIARWVSSFRNTASPCNHKPCRSKRTMQKIFSQKVLDMVTSLGLQRPFVYEVGDGGMRPAVKMLISLPRAARGTLTAQFDAGSDSRFDSHQLTSTLHLSLCWYDCSLVALLKVQCYIRAARM